MCELKISHERDVLVHCAFIVGLSPHMRTIIIMLLELPTYEPRKSRRDLSDFITKTYGKLSGWKGEEGFLQND